MNILRANMEFGHELFYSRTGNSDSQDWEMSRLSFQSALNVDRILVARLFGSVFFLIYVGLLTTSSKSRQRRGCRAECVLESGYVTQEPSDIGGSFVGDDLINEIVELRVALFGFAGGLRLGS